MKAAPAWFVVALIAVVGCTARPAPTPLAAFSFLKDVSRRDVTTRASR